ncbi:MAG TPA: DUF1223 domain-containing protein, partial [Hyphomonas sp.]|nr:DUF1223 domain-containing protein [Hyphomonas sp.]
MIRLVLLLALICGFAAPARAEGPVLIELFASKNCRTCPAAYKTLASVEQEHGRKVLIITWPVDYWDYLG